MDFRISRMRTCWCHFPLAHLAVGSVDIYGLQLVELGDDLRANGRSLPQPTVEAILQVRGGIRCAVQKVGTPDLAVLLNLVPQLAIVEPVTGSNRTLCRV